MSIYVEKPCIRLRACRANAGLTQQELADILEVSANTINNWESGATTPNSKVIHKISVITGVPEGLIFLPD